jgi:hypothetical protein
MKGIEINEKSLEELGCEQTRPGVFVMNSRGYSFSFHRRFGDSWTFISPGEEYGHAVTHLDECFGGLAEDLLLRDPDPGLVSQTVVPSRNEMALYIVILALVLVFNFFLCWAMRR